MRDICTGITKRKDTSAMMYRIRCGKNCLFLTHIWDLRDTKKAIYTKSRKEGD